jgi:hypothetical protein
VFLCGVPNPAEAAPPVLTPDTVGEIEFLLLFIVENPCASVKTSHRHAPYAAETFSSKRQTRQSSFTG